MLKIPPQTLLNEYFILGEISSYAKNAVFKAYIPNPEEEFNDKTKCYILKSIPYDTDEDKESYRNEEEILHMFDVIPTIIKYNKTFILKSDVTGGKQFLFAVMDFYPYIDLFDFYTEHENEEISPEFIKSVAYQALNILSIIHKENIVHHDIKPANFLIESLSPILIKITDFEFAVKLKGDEPTDQPFGTHFYMAPEIIQCLPHGKSVDIWALGITLYELAAKKLPFNLQFNQPQRFIINLKLKKNELLFDDNFHDPQFKDLLSKMLEKDPLNRISADDALKHPFFDGYQSGL